MGVANPYSLLSTYDYIVIKWRHRDPFCKIKVFLWSHQAHLHLVRIHAVMKIIWRPSAKKSGNRELSKKFFNIRTGVQGLVVDPVLFIIFLATLTQVAFPAGSKFCEEMEVELEQAEGDITDMKKYRGSAVCRILETISADDTALLADNR